MHCILNCHLRQITNGQNAANVLILKQADKLKKYCRAVALGIALMVNFIH